MPDAALARVVALLQAAESLTADQKYERARFVDDSYLRDSR